MSFATVPADAYDRFMGRYSVLLSPQLADLGGVAPGQRVLDVGCGPGALTAELVARTGASNVTAVDPSPSVDQIVTKIWDAISERNKGQPSAGLRAINFDHEKVGVSHTNTADSTFLGTTAQGVSIACEAVDAGYQYGTENHSPTSSDAGLFVIMSFLAHSNSASNAAPMYRLTWRR